MDLKAMIKRVWRYTWRPRSFNKEMHLEAVILQLRDSLGGRDRASWVIHLDTMTYQDWRSTWTQSFWRSSIGRELQRQLRHFSFAN